MNTLVREFILPLSPVVALLSGALALTCLQWIPYNRAQVLLIRAIAILSSLGSLVASVWLTRVPMWDPSVALSQEKWLMGFREMYLLDDLALTFYVGITGFLFLTLIFVEVYFAGRRVLGEIQLLLLFIGLGMLLLVSGNSLLILFLALELVSLPTYVLVGLHSRDRNSCEAALKYFLFGAFASVLLALGIALVYAEFGTLQIPSLLERAGNAVTQGTNLSAFAYAGLALFIVAGGFKVGLAPFHMWVPDVYQGAPMPVTGFMGSAVKLTGFALIAKFLWGVFLPLTSQWQLPLDILAVLSMWVGNLAALKQNNLKRLFAYSSIAHAGYILFAITSVGTGALPIDILYYYLLVYGLMFLGVFAVLGYVEQQTQSSDISALSGLGFQKPVLGFCLALLTLSSAGIPPTAGFLAKYFIFFQSVSLGKTVLVLLAVLSSLVGLYYYLRVLVFLYMKEPAKDRPTMVAVPPVLYGGVLLCSLAVLLFALFPL